MKFEYDGDSEQRECVAYIFTSRLRGGPVLSVKTDDGQCLFWSDGTVNTQDRFNIANDDATRKFYPGDKLTITF